MPNLTAHKTEIITQLTRILSDRNCWTIGIAAEGTEHVYDIITVGFNAFAWAYQTNNNSYSGIACLYTNWVVCNYYPDDTAEALWGRLLESKILY